MKWSKFFYVIQINALKYQIILFLVLSEEIANQRSDVDFPSTTNEISYQDLRISIRCMINTLLMLLSQVNDSKIHLIDSR